MKYAILDILEKKRDGKELTWEQMQAIVHAAQLGNAHAAQIGAFLMACHLRGLNEGEVENLMRAMMFSGRLMKWPSEWKQKIVSLQSTGSTGNKAKLILAPAMAACGVKFPILSARGYDAIGGILDKLRTIPGFSGIKTVKEIEQLLEDVGCCVVQQPSDIAPAEGVIRDMAAIAGTSDNDAFKEACMIARVAALKLHAIVIDIPYGAGEWVKTKEEAMSMANNLDRLRSILGIKIKVLVTAVDWPVGTMMGQSLEIAEAMRSLNMVGPPDLHELVIKLGGHLLHEAGVADTPEAGQQRVHRVIRDGKAKKMFEKMLRAQGVDKSNLKSLMKPRKDPNNMSSVLPVANYFTHLSSGDLCGYVHKIDMKVLNQVMFDMIKASAEVEVEKDGSCAGGFQLLVKPGSFMKKGECWAKMHHNMKLDDIQVARLQTAITFVEEKCSTGHELKIQEFHAGSFKVIRSARLSMPNIFGHEGTMDTPPVQQAEPIVEEEENEPKPKVHFLVADSDDSTEDETKKKADS